MESLRYLALCLAFGVIAVWAGENMFWFIPPGGLQPLDLTLTVIAYSIASGVGLSLVIWTGVGGLSAAFLGGAVMGYMAEGVIAGTIYDPLPFYWVWTPLAWHALIAGGLAFGVGRAGATLGAGRMALVWTALGVAAAYWGQYWPSEMTGAAALPTVGTLASYLVGFGILVVLAQVGMDRIGQLPRPAKPVLWVAPAIAMLVWLVQGAADLNPWRVVLPLVMALLLWVMRRLGHAGAPISLGAPVPVWQHALILIAPAIAVLLAPLGWAQGWGTLSSNIVVAVATCLLSLIWLGRLIWRAIRI
ncbi:MAG: hypothetical protein J0L76_07750 [Rhodobacterales bacterium]|nr:hypothetical protein [Rhodobacterales bacterium]